MMQNLQLHGLVPSKAEYRKAAPPHELLRCGPISALISDMSHDHAADDMPPDALADWAMTHNAILTAYCADTTVVPMALGAVFSGKPAIIASLESQMDAHIAKLSALEGIQEFVVHLTTTPTRPPAQESPTSGRHFLQIQRNRRDGRHSLQKQQLAFAQAVLNQLQTPCLQIAAAGTRKADKLLNCVVLIRQDDVFHLQDMARGLHQPAQDLGLDLVITGPWPPYSSAALKAPVPEVCHVADA
ncbi:MAG: GvpL/GvpF family gas vesicle protein [Pseudomonadota bacterium]